MRANEYQAEMLRICNFFKCSEEEVKNMFHSETLDSGILLRWSKLLEYDFFRVYSHHLILYSPPASQKGFKQSQSSRKSNLPQFRKNIYTTEIIEFILEQIKTQKKTKQEIIAEYRIPKTTLYKWISKYKDNEKDQ